MNVRYRGWSLESKRSQSRLPFASWPGRLNACIDRCLLNDLNDLLSSELQRPRGLNSARAHHEAVKSLKSDDKWQFLAALKC